MPADNLITLHQNEELVSDDIREIISYRPHWIIRKGNVVFLAILFLLIALTYIIQYPDMVNASARIVALNPPKNVNAKSEGKLLKLFAKDEEEVKKDQHLGFIESTASYNEVMMLYKWTEDIIDSITGYKYDIVEKKPLPALQNLGELQANYQGFQNELQLTRQTLANGYYRKKLNALKKDIQYMSLLKDNIYRQQKLQQQDQELQQNEYKAYEKLAEEKVIAPIELNQYKSKLLAKDQSIEQVESQLTNNDVSTHAKQKEILETYKQVIDQQQRFYSSLLELKSEIEKWVHNYVLQAPEDGKLLYVTTLKENQLINQGQNLFYVEPEEINYYAELTAGQRGFGKIKTGQQVRIKVESYPDAEFGYLNGTVNYISGMPNRRDSFLIKVELPHGLQTNYHKNIFFRNNLSAQAEIITVNRRLIERFFNQLKKVWER
ncbi:MAG TPA: HlyD family efflux transporter periplasmic adaptor subunit [Chitinophagaceae bacterium]|nr:HlyD family efflux transporter periplasmic adaptor subunit [Chitinophagaceae bacterium]